jgi:hypothetical protein
MKSNSHHLPQRLGAAAVVEYVRDENTRRIVPRQSGNKAFTVQRIWVN